MGNENIYSYDSNLYEKTATEIVHDFYLYHDGLSFHIDRFDNAVLTTEDNTYTIIVATEYSPAKDEEHDPQVDGYTYSIYVGGEMIGCDGDTTLETLETVLKNWFNNVNHH